MNGRLGMTGDGVVRGDAVFGKAMTKTQRDNAAGAAVGTGGVLAAGGLVGGGIPGARPDSGRLRHVATNTKGKAAATRHIVSATRGGIFGYREDAHRAFLNGKNKDLRGWRPDPANTGNNFERGVAQGKVQPEKTIIRQMARARTGSNIALGGGAALIAGGSLMHRRNKRRVAKRSDYKENALLTGGGATAVAGFGGAKLLEHQGRKWANKTAEHVQAARKINPNLGGYEWKKTRQRKLLGPAVANVPDARAHRSTNDIVGDAWNTHAGQTKEQAVAAGKHRGAATQSRYFARVYGSQARVARKVGAAGALVAATGLAGKHYEIKRRGDVRKGYADPPPGTIIPGVARRYDERGKIVPLRKPAPKVEPEVKLVHVVHRAHGRKHMLIASGVSAATGAAGGYAVGRHQRAPKKKPHDWNKKLAPTDVDWSPTAVHPTFPKQQRVRKADEDYNRATRRANIKRMRRSLPQHVNDQIDDVVHSVHSGELQNRIAENNRRLVHAVENAHVRQVPTPSRRTFPKKTAIGLAAGTALAAGGVYALNRIGDRKRRAHFAAKRTMAKSWIPGKGYVSAVDVPKSQLRELAVGGKRSVARNRLRSKNRTEAMEFRRTEQDNLAFQRKHGTWHSTKGGAIPHSVSHQVMNAENGPHTRGFMIKTGGRSRPGTAYVRPDSMEHTVAHEAAHATPKRTSYRLHQIAQKPKKIMREEARADFRAGTDYAGHHWTRTAYASAANNKASRADMFWASPPSDRKLWSKKSVKAYRKVQDRMHAAEGRGPVRKVDTTMSETAAHKLARQYDTRGPLPKTLSREDKMKAYEARYIASGGKKGEKWKKRADRAEVGRNIGLVGATTSAAALLAARGKKTGPKMAANRVLRHATPHRLETAALGSALGGGWSELYGEHARSRRASYANSPAGVAGSALTRMRAYTPEKRTS